MEIKQHLYRIAEKHLVIEHVISDQAEEWGSVEAEVLQSYWNLMAIYAYLSSIVRQLIATLPDIFEGSDTLVQLACQIIKSYHYRRRFLSKQQSQPTTLSSTTTRKFVMSVTLVFIYFLTF